MRATIILIAVFILAHIGLAIYAINKVARTNMFSNNQKVANIVLVALVPLFWSVLMHYMLKRQPGSYEVEVKNDVSSNVFHESGKGSPGVGAGRI